MFTSRFGAAARDSGSTSGAGAAPESAGGASASSGVAPISGSASGGASGPAESGTATGLLEGGGETVPLPMACSSKETDADALGVASVSLPLNVTYQADSGACSGAGTSAIPRGGVPSFHAFRNGARSIVKDLAFLPGFAADWAWSQS